MSATSQDWYKEFYKGYKDDLDRIKTTKRNKFVKDTATLYRYFNADQELLYIGVTIRPISRQRGHVSSTKWWTEVASATFQRGFSTEQELYTAEAAAIAEENPKYNIAGDSIFPSENPTPRNAD